MLQSEPDQIAALYAGLMEEIKRRVDVVRQALLGRYALPLTVAFELCYLQLREICEVFALTCLVAHGDLPGLRRKFIQKSYQADHLIKELSKLRPQFYPV